MAWEERSGRSYYYRKEREGDRVRSVYVGGGETAALIAQLDGMRREEVEHERELEKRARAEAEAPDAEHAALDEMFKLITKGALLAAGFHTHKRQWRRKKL